MKNCESCTRKNTSSNTEIVLVSSCLYGMKCRYDAGSRLTDEVDFREKNTVFIPVCPEEIGGFGTPRSPVFLSGGDGRAVLSGKAQVLQHGSRTDVTDRFILAAEKVLRLAKKLGVKKILLKSKSPSCGVTSCYIEETLSAGMGVTAALLKREGFILEEYNG